MLCVSYTGVSIKDGEIQGCPDNSVDWSYGTFVVPLFFKYWVGTYVRKNKNFGHGKIAKLYELPIIHIFLLSQVKGYVNNVFC